MISLKQQKDPSFTGNKLLMPQHIKIPTTTMIFLGSYLQENQDYLKVF